MSDEKQAFARGVCALSRGKSGKKSSVGVKLGVKSCMMRIDDSDPPALGRLEYRSLFHIWFVSPIRSTGFL